MGPKLRRMRVEQRGTNWHRRMRLALANKGLSKEDLSRATAELNTRKSKFVNDLAEFEEHVYKNLLAKARQKRDGAKRGPKWNDVLAEVRTTFQEAGTHKSWLAAERALGE